MLIYIFGGFSVIATVALIILIVLMLRKKEHVYDDSKLTEGIQFLQREIQDVRKTFDTRMHETARDINASVKTQLTESTRIVKEVTEGLGKLSETNNQVVSFAEQLRQLSDVLKNPKQRGVLGEYYLETVLQNVLPPKTFVMQYGFENGEIVDAALFIKDKIIPVDSKFSLENYNRILESRDAPERERYEKLFKADLKLRIDETSKYVRPEEGTTEFAFMFIPSEGVYYDLLVSSVGTGVSARDLIEYAFTKKVIIVSPTSFLAYLQTVVHGLKALQIEEKAKEIQMRVGELGKHIVEWESYYSKLGNTLGTAVGHFNSGYKKLKQIDKDVFNITGTQATIATTLLEKPLEEE